MANISIKNLTFCYEGSYDNIFENVSFQINTDWKLGLVGRNGKGKTTLLRLFLNELEYKGKIDTTVSFEYFPYTIHDTSLNIYQIIEMINPNYEEWKVYKEMNLLELENIDFSKSFDTYSNGEREKILLAILFSKENTFLLIDEPTNHLDKYGRQMLSNYLKKKDSYIIVSHDIKFVDNCIDHVMSINKTEINILNGNLSTYLQNKAFQEQFELTQNEKIMHEIKHLKESSRRTSDWADKTEQSKYGGKQASGLKVDRGYVGAKSAKLMKSATVMKNRIEDCIEEKTELLKNVEREDKIQIVAKEFFKNNLVSIKDLQVCYGERKVNCPISLDINQGDKVSLVGKNGCGKTSVLKAILGEIKTFFGEINMSERLEMSYVSQDTSFITGNLKDFCFNCKVDYTKCLVMLNKLGFDRKQFEKPLQDLSEGQKKKLLIAKSLCQEANLFIWDEPLNYIDIISRNQIKQMLQESNVTMVFVEHDVDFSEKVATKEIVIEKFDVQW